MAPTYPKAGSGATASIEPLMLIALGPTVCAG